MKSLLLLLIFPLLPSGAPGCDEQILQEVARQAPIVVIARVVKVAQEPGVWSGFVLVDQRVLYEVKTVLKGKLSRHEIDVGHFVVYNSSTADLNKARLSPKLFAIGNELILFIKPDSRQEGDNLSDPQGTRTYERYISLDANCGAVIADSERVAMVRRVLSTK